MTTFKDAGFKMDRFALSFIIKAVQDVKTVKVEDMAENLTDRHHPATFTPEEIQWMKNTPIARITMGETYIEETSEFFDLLVDNESKLKISDRSPTMGEFRGSIVREVIESAQSSNKPDLTVYDALQAHISNVAKNSSFSYVASAVADTFVQDYGFDPNSQIYISLKNQLIDRLNSFGQSIFNSLDDLTTHYLENEELTNQGLGFLQNKLQIALEEKPVSPEIIDFLNAFKKFKEQLEIVKDKLLSFEKGSNARNAGMQLGRSLSKARGELTRGDISISKFKEDCEAACDTAEQSALKEHRGWKQVFANIGFAVASISTLGIANIISKITTGSFNFAKTNTDSINKVQEMKGKLREIRSDIDNVDNINVEANKPMNTP